MDFDLAHIFTYHAPGESQKLHYQAIRDRARLFADTVLMVVPDGTDRDEAIKHIREAVMFANAGIALGGRLKRA